MKKRDSVKTIIAILFANLISNAWTKKEMELLLPGSNDNLTRVLERVYEGTSPSSDAGNPDIVKFYTLVSARYFKFNATQANSGDYSGMRKLYGMH